MGGRRDPRRAVWAGALFVLAFGSVAAGVATGGAPAVVDTPPEDPYVRRGLLPGGFEHDGTWTAHRRTPLYKAPGSREVVATLDACEEITEEATELRGHPQELRVLRAHGPFRKGERMWILAHDLEEGYRELWYRGEIRDEVEVSLEEALSSDESCNKPAPRCWLWVARETPQEMWIRMRRKDGTRGWSKRAEDFTEGGAQTHPCP
jgi:hypothetical protein